MKPPPFDYDAPTSVEEALELLGAHGSDAKVLAGGQSLVPLLNFRLARPEKLIDINGLGALGQIRRRDRHLHIGALSRQSALERSELVSAHWPLLHQAIDFVAHAQIRNRGTVGGSIAHADPAAEFPVALAALDGTVLVRSRRGDRTVPWNELFVTHLTTSLEPDELLVEVIVPPLPPGTTTAFVEYARRHGDFALGGAAVTLTVDDSGVCGRRRLRCWPRRQRHCARPRPRRRSAEPRSTPRRREKQPRSPCGTSPPPATSTAAAPTAAASSKR